MADCRHIEHRFGHNLAADYLISVKFCVWKQFFIEFLYTGQRSISTERIFL